MKAKTKKPKERYPYLWGCYVDEKYNRRYTRKYLQGVIELQAYKGAILLTVLDDDEKRREARQLLGVAHQIPSAWLMGDDLDALIAMLRDAKRTWLTAYRKAERKLAKDRKAKTKR